MLSKVSLTVFIAALAVSVAGGLLLVASQIVGIAFGAAAFAEALNTDIKPWIVGTSAVAAMASFVLLYLREPETETPS